LNDESRPVTGGDDQSPSRGDEPAPGTSPSVALPSPRESVDTGSGRELGTGSRVGGYVLGECIGQGGMARVYRAEHEGLQRQVALKVLLDAPGGTTDSHERFLREARIAAAIKHPNVVNIFDVGVDRGRPYLVMELLEGADLDAFMGGKNRLDEATVMDIIVPIAGALAAVHDAGVVHRDLKPGNIFLSRGHNDELEPRLLDFGISKASGDKLRLTSAHGPVMGTPFYMSPEAASGAEMTPLSDQYALGVVLYECLTGVNPFAAATNFAEVVHRLTTGDFTPAAVQNPQLSKRMAAIIERAMQLDPARRFADMRAMGRELLLLAGQRTRVTWGLTFNNPVLGALAHAPIDYHDQPPVTVRERPRRRRSGLLVPALLTLVLASGAWATGALGPDGAARAGLAAFAARTGLLAPSAPTAERVAAPAGQAPLTMALRPGPQQAEEEQEPSPGSAGVQPGRVLPLATVEDTSEALAVHQQPATTGLEPSSTGSAQSTALAVSQALRGARPRLRAASTRSKDANARGASSPEWLSTRDRSASVAGGTRYGTNGAPIFD
jgi:serine/threonine protein kinase